MLEFQIFAVLVSEEVSIYYQFLNVDVQGFAAHQGDAHSTFNADVQGFCETSASSNWQFITLWNTRKMK